jgi:hypothetical protein
LTHNRYDSTILNHARYDSAALKPQPLW